MRQLINLGATLLVAIATAGPAFASIPCNRSDEANYPETSLQGSVSVYNTQVTITIDVPAAEHITKCSISPFEYGTAIYFTTSTEEPVISTISVESPVGLRGTKRQTKSKYLTLEPTLIAREREKWPHYVRVTDDQAGMIYDLFIDRSGKVAKTRFYQKRVD